jgi:PAS domain S-box-containing protein
MNIHNPHSEGQITGEAEIINGVEDDYLNIFDAINEAIYILDESGKFLTVNSGAVEMYGYPRDYFTGKTPGFISAPGRNDLSSTMEKINLAYNGSPQRFEFWGIRKSGQIFPKEVRLCAGRYLGEKVVVALGMDISERALKEQHTQISENRYRVIGSLISDFAYTVVKNEEGELFNDWITDSFYSETGYSRNDFEKHNTWMFCIHSEDRDSVLRQVKLLKPGEELIHEFRIWNADEKCRWIRNHIKYEADNKDFSTGRIYGAAKDISENKRVVEILERSEDAFRQINNCLLHLTSDHKKNIEAITALCGKLLKADCAFYIRLNDGAIEISGWNIPENFAAPAYSSGSICFDMIKNRNAGSLVIPDLTSSPYYNTDLNIKNCGIKSYMGHVIRAHEENRGALCVIYKRLYKPAQEDLSVLGILSSAVSQVEERLITELELIRAKENAEELNRLKTSFLANMSHELRTPMHGILGLTQVLREQLKDPKKIDMTEMIITSGKRLLNTLNMILTLSRIEANRQEIEFEKIALFSAIEQSVKLFFSMAKNKGLDLKFIPLSKELPFITDRQMFESVLNNLIDNAIKYTNKGSVIVSAKMELTDGDNWVVIKVRDTGIGISPENQKLIFEEFRQVSEGYNRAFEGTGLGLSIIRRYIDLLKGSICLKSAVGAGSEFTVKLPSLIFDVPLKTAFSREPEPEIYRERNAEDKMKILIVDDDDISIDILEIWLKNNHLTDYAKDIEGALYKLRKNSYHAVFMDINLKRGESGIELLKKLRGIEGYLNIPVIACTAYAMPGDENRLKAEGFNYYISKPFQKKELLLLLDEIMEKEKN